MSLYSRQQAIEQAEANLRSYEVLLKQYIAWRTNVYTAPYADHEDQQLRRQFSESHFMISDLSPEEFNELELDYQATRLQA